MASLTSSVVVEPAIVVETTLKQTRFVLALSMKSITLTLNKDKHSTRVAHFVLGLSHASIQIGVNGEFHLSMNIGELQGWDLTTQHTFFPQFLCSRNSGSNSTLPSQPLQLAHIEFDTPSVNGPAASSLQFQLLPIQFIYMHSFIMELQNYLMHGTYCHERSCSIVFILIFHRV